MGKVKTRKDRLIRVGQIGFVVLLVLGFAQSGSGNEPVAGVLAFVWVALCFAAAYVIGDERPRRDA